MPIDKIKKRDGRITDFDRARIERAIDKACKATRTIIAESSVFSLTEGVIVELESRFIERVPGVEDVQDIVERMLQERELFDVAKAYILYRKERASAREEKKREVLDRLEKHQIVVKNRRGASVPFDIQEVERMVLAISTGVENKITVEEIVSEVKFSMYEGITTSEINKAITFALRARIERDPIYASLGAKMLFNDLYKELLGVYGHEKGFEAIYKEAFSQQIKRGVGSGRLDPRMLLYDLKKLGEHVEIKRDELIQYLGAQTLYDRYLLRDYNQVILELPQYFWMRIAMGLALKEETSEKRASEFYDVMSQLLYVPSTPTLFHAGTTHPQMSSCYLTTVEDDLAHIFKCIGDDAKLAKWSGGLGNDWTNIRGTGSLIKSTNVGSQGVIPFIKIVDSTTAAINRSGKRRGATCVYLETWHYDIEDFLELRKNTGDERRRTHDTNTANWIPDLFMKRVLEDRQWTLFSPDETPDLHHMYGREFEKRYEAYERMADEGKIHLFKRVRANDLWRKMITMLNETGHPWITFKDPCNIRSPQDHAGVVHSSNLCTEITLNTSKDETAVCNLGSINMATHIKKGILDKRLLQETVSIAIRMLDNVIDLNYYPTPEAENSNLKHRPIGLGIMGLHDAMYKMTMRFDSDEAVIFSDELTEFISYNAILNSSLLAKEKGSYASYKGSKWDRGIFPIDTLRLLEEERGIQVDVDKTARLDWGVARDHVKLYGMRNSNCLAIAPTATIANISGVVPSIEPMYKNVYVKSNFSGEFTVMNEYLVEDLKKRGLWNDDMIQKLKYHDGSVSGISEIPREIRDQYKEAFEIDPFWVIRHGAVRGKWIDQSQSINIFAGTSSGRIISDIYVNAWKSGLKTTYYLRSLGASAIEKSTLDINKKFDEVQASIDAPALECKVKGEDCEACQ